jgi:hypothetical protein
MSGGPCNVRNREMVAATGMSRSYASDIKAGQMVPDPRYWPSQATLTAIFGPAVRSHP